MIHGTLPALGMGLGAYPNDYFYDPNRPNWLPYWLDTPTESELKYRTDSILSAVPGAAVAIGQSAGEVIGSTVGGAASGIVQSTFGAGGISGTLLLGIGIFLGLKVFRII